MHDDHEKALEGFALAQVRGGSAHTMRCLDGSPEPGSREPSVHDLRADHGKDHVGSTPEHDRRGSVHTLHCLLGSPEPALHAAASLLRASYTPTALGA